MNRFPATLVSSGYPWAMGWTVFLTEETVRSVSEIVPWLEEAIVHFFPASSYIQSLSPELQKRPQSPLSRS